MKHNPKEKIITQLNNGRKTWTELMRTVNISSKTLSRTLKILMEQGTVVKFGVVEFGKIADYYDLVKKKESTISLKVPRMFEESFVFPLVFKEGLDIEQNLVQWLHHRLRMEMHFARKTLAVRFTKELTPKQRIEYINNWKMQAVNYASEWMAVFIEEIVHDSEASWIDIFGTYEDDLKDLINAVAKFTEIINKAEKKQNEKLDDSKMMNVS